MKNYKLAVKKTVLVLGLTVLGMVGAVESHAALPFNEGGYTGRLNRKDTINLMVRKLDGREGSFMAVIFKKRDDACVYIVDPTESPAKYVMTPLQVTPDGEIGFNNDNPSLTMTITNNVNPNDPEFTLVNANGGNSACVQGSAAFKGRDSRFHWEGAIVPGAYRAGGIHKVAHFSGAFVAPGDSSQEGSVTLTRPFKRPGDYTVREKAPGLFTLKLSGYTAVGATEEQNPSYIGFTASTAWGSAVYLINPADHTDVLSLSK